MKSIRDLLQEADPLQHEQPYPPDVLNTRRQAVLGAASAGHVPSRARSRLRLATFAASCLILVLVLFFGSRAGFVFLGDLQAAVRFEVKLAEDKPSPGLREVKASGSEKPVYVHEQVVVTNSDIASARVLADDTPGEYSVAVEFTAAGAEKMRRATAAHIGKPMAVFIDGQVVMTPTVRSLISTSAAVTGDFTKAEAERIVNGIALE